VSLALVGRVAPAAVVAAVVAVRALGVAAAATFVQRKAVARPGDDPPEFLRRLAEGEVDRGDS
jgi:hypothetical protein